MDKFKLIPPDAVEKTSLAWLQDSWDAEASAKSKYKELLKDKEPYPHLRLVVSNHPYSEGWYVEWGETGAKEITSEFDHDISHLADKRQTAY